MENRSNGYLPETWELLSGRYKNGPIPGLTDSTDGPLTVVSPENRRPKDVPVRGTRSVDELMAAVLSAGFDPGEGGTK